MKRRKKFVQALSLKTHMVSPDLCSWVMAFQLMQWFTPHLLDKSDCTICTARSPLFHLKAQPIAASGPDWQRSDFRVTARILEIYYALKLIIFQCATRHCFRNVIYGAGASSISKPSAISHMCSPLSGSIQRDILTTRRVLSLPAALVCITASDIKVEPPLDDCKQFGWKWAMIENKMVTGST